MKRQIILLMVIVISSFAQWQPTDTTNVGITGSIVTHGNTIFQYGSYQGYRIYRSTNNGTSWENISAALPSNFSNIYSFGGELFGIYFSNIYVSTNNGDSWTLRSSVTVPGGVIMGLTSNGSNLYAFSNRKSFFVSTNNGKNWNEIIINDPRNMGMVNFASGGGTHVAVFGNVGALISTNNGTTWVDKNPAAGAISGLYSFNNIIFGFSFGGGIYKIGANDTGWIAVNKGIADNGLYQIPKSMYGNATTLYVGVYAVISYQTKIYSSINNGETWDTLSTTGLFLNNTTVTPWFLTANQSNVFVYCYGTKIHGVYSLPRTTSVTDVSETLPIEFSLAQNYPNPFNPTTVISYQLSANSNVTLKVYDVLGKEVATLVNEYQLIGKYSFHFSSINNNLASGIYFYRLQTENFSATKRMMLLK